MQSLDGTWQLVLDPNNAGRGQAWFAPALPAAACRPIQVPGSILEVEPGYEGVFWCGRSFIPSVCQCSRLASLSAFRRRGLRLRGVAQRHAARAHEGGQSPFEFDVTKTLVPGRPNHLTLRIAGPFAAVFGGISQHVTLVVQPAVRIQDVFARADLQTGRIQLHVTLQNNSGAPAAVALGASYGEYKPRKDLGIVRAKATVAPGSAVATMEISVGRPHPWDLDDPFLYSIGLTSDWAAAGSPAAGRDTYSLRTGFRDFRIVDGWFYLNGKRIYPKSAHSNWYDPIAIYGTPRTMEYLGRDFALMKSAGFNMFRFIVSAALPEQLDLADELGLLIYSEHETSWPALYKPGTKFGVSLDDVVRRDRNHPSLVIWGLLNETPPGDTYNAAKGWLPSLRAVDETRLVLLSSGRWDADLKTGSASNPGSRSWDVYLGGEDPVKPVPGAGLPTDIGAYRGGVGDAHVYQAYPTTWNFITVFSELGRTTRPVFLSEAGLGSSYNAMRDRRKMQQAGAPGNAYAWRWIAPAVQTLPRAWAAYHLETLYPSIEDMLVDSELNAARQREIMFNIVRSNPHVNGYSLTSWVDCWGLAEGVIDGFREFKPGHLAALQAGWAKLRWCLFVNPMHVYAGAPVHLKVALASEDALPAGTYPATLRITGGRGILWQKAVSVTIPAGKNPPLAYAVLDEDVTVAGLAAGTYALSATLENRANAASHEVSFFVSEKAQQPREPRPDQRVGLGPPARAFLTARGATLGEFAAQQQVDREVVLVGDVVAGGAATWRALVHPRRPRGPRGLSVARGLLGRQDAQPLAGPEEQGRPGRPPGLALPQGHRRQAASLYGGTANQAHDARLLRGDPGRHQVLPQRDTARRYGGRCHPVHDGRRRLRVFFGRGAGHLPTPCREVHAEQLEPALPPRPSCRRSAVVEPAHACAVDRRDCPSAAGRLRGGTRRAGNRRLGRKSRRMFSGPVCRTLLTRRRLSMPELPEVESMRRGIACLVGCTICDLRNRARDCRRSK